MTLFASSFSLFVSEQAFDLLKQPGSKGDSLTSDDLAAVTHAQWREVSYLLVPEVDISTAPSLEYSILSFNLIR